MKCDSSSSFVVRRRGEKLTTPEKNRSSGWVLRRVHLPFRPTHVERGGLSGLRGRMYFSVPWSPVTLLWYLSFCSDQALFGNKFGCVCRNSRGFYRRKWRGASKASEICSVACKNSLAPSSPIL